jgi:uncharacterized membrane protein
MSIVRALFAAALFLVASAPAAFADPQKLALIVTNKDYPASIGALENTHRDGERIAAALTALGFDVVHKRDLDKSAMLAAVADYVGRLDKAGPDAVGFFYYAGHGAANSKYGENYLLPIGSAIGADAQLPLLGVKLGEVIDAIGATPARSNFVVFDACRDVAISFATRSAERGLRRENQRKGMLVAFATDPGKTATDEGVYAEALAEEMQRPGVEAVQMFRAVRRRVLAATGERQFPWTAEGLVEDFYFKPSLLGAPGSANASLPKPGIRHDEPAPYSQEPQKTGLRLCNNTASRLGVALGYKDKDGWTSEGWWNVDSQSCELLIQGELRARFFYLYAFDYDKGGEWGGPIPMCTKDIEFTIKGSENCERRGFKKSGFFEVDTQKSEGWTVKLTDQEVSSSASRK